jgi:hypothetical protein
MFKMIEHRTNCEIRSVIRFLNARNLNPADIHCQICEVYDENFMRDGMVRKWVRKFNEVRDNVHEEPRCGRPSMVSDDLLRTVVAKVRAHRPFRRCP